jgi:hypothetical protein
MAALVVGNDLSRPSLPISRRTGFQPLLFEADHWGWERKHSADHRKAVGPVRKFLSGHRSDRTVLGRDRIPGLYRDFSGELPAFLEAVEQDREINDVYGIQGLCEPLRCTTTQNTH